MHALADSKKSKALPDATQKLLNGEGVSVGESMRPMQRAGLNRRCSCAIC